MVCITPKLRLSLPSRGAWIEIAITMYENGERVVAPLAGSVDRNFKRCTESDTTDKVAPLAGSVDRNAVSRPPPPAAFVAPLAGSVDRNHPLIPHRPAKRSVAPLAGSVDRNSRASIRVALFRVAPLAGSVDRNVTRIERVQ